MQRCSFEGCENVAWQRTLCQGHYSQQYRGTELRPLKDGKGPPRKDAIHIYRYGAYTRCVVWPDHRLYQYCTTFDKVGYGRAPYHRLVMAEELGRKLSPRETVHHIDGDTSNNTVENLQLRHGRHGKGKKIICADCGSHNTMAVELD